MADTSIKHDNYTSDDITDYHYCCHNVAGNHSGKFIVYPDNAQSGENGFSDIFVSVRRLFLLPPLRQKHCEIPQ